MARAEKFFQMRQSDYAPGYVLLPRISFFIGDEFRTQFSEGDVMGEILVDKFLSFEMKKALNRRGFVRNLGLAGAALAGTGLLSACGGSSSGSSMMTAQAATLDNTSGDSAQQVFTAALIAEDLASTFYFNGVSAGAITSAL
jgi:hypothetical protein